MGQTPVADVVATASLESGRFSAESPTMRREGGWCGQGRDAEGGRHNRDGEACAVSPRRALS
jgi:hypothetical protein